MAEQVDNRLIYEILKSVQLRLANLEALCSEMSDVFALMRAGVTSRDADVLERRLAELERTLDRLGRRLEADRF
jgi:hypothetical protein